MSKFTMKVSRSNSSRQRVNSLFKLDDHKQSLCMMVFYFLKGDITPFVSGGIGIAIVDANIEGGPGTGAYVPPRTENDMSYGAGIGVRYDFSRLFSMQGSYNKSWIDMSKASGTPDFSVWRLDFVFPI